MTSGPIAGDPTIGAVNLKWFGAKGDSETDDSAAVQACVDWAQGRKIYAPAGEYVLNAGVATAAPLNLVGDGSGVGPGANANANCTRFIANAPGLTVFAVKSMYASSFRDFTIDVGPQFRGACPGSGIALTAPGSACATSTKFENLGLLNLFRGIDMYRPAWCRISECYFQGWVDSAIHSQTDQPTIEASAGTIRDCYFFSQGCQAACIALQNGYTIVDGCEILGAQFGVRFSVTGHEAGFLKIVNNTIENQIYGGISLASGDGTHAALVDISHNEFSALNDTYIGSVFVSDNNGVKWLRNLSICDNETHHALAAGSRHFWVGAGENVRIAGNIMEELGANNPQAIYIGGSASNAALGAPIQVLDNIAISTASPRFAGPTKYAFAAPATLRDLQGTPFVALPAMAANGSQVYVPDGVRGSAPLVGGGTGALATRLNGSWVG